MFCNNIVEFSEKKIAFIFTTGKREKNDFLKPPDENETFSAYVVTTNAFALNHDKSFQIYFFCVKTKQKTTS